MGWVIIILAVVGLLLSMLLHPDERRARFYEKQFSVRDALNDADLHRQYFTADMPLQTPARVRRILAEHMGYPADKILPDDDFMFYWREIDLEDVFKDLEEEFNISVTQSEIRNSTCTVRSLADLVNRLSKSPCPASI